MNPGRCPTERETIKTMSVAYKLSTTKCRKKCALSLLRFPAALHHNRSRKQNRFHFRKLLATRLPTSSHLISANTIETFSNYWKSKRYLKHHFKESEIVRSSCNTTPNG